MIQKEFEKEGYKFRVNISSVSLLSLKTTMNFEKPTLTEETYKYMLEHVEVQVKDKWFPVKVKGKEDYFPVGIENKIVLLEDICYFFMREVVMKTFQKSDELNPKPTSVTSEDKAKI